MRSLEDWLAFIEQQHVSSIDLTLERARMVFDELLPQGIQCPVITVAGTNGKGSTVACIERLVIDQALKPLVYTSPHLIDYRERVAVGGKWLSKELHVKAFEAVEKARARVDVSLTYFEYATLAAFYLAGEIKVDLLILEVGLGGRLDAVNLHPADIAVITSIGLDHQEWLGDSLEAIAREKAGIIHPGKTAIIADDSVPDDVLQEISERAGQLIRIEDPQSVYQDLYAPFDKNLLTFPINNALASIKAVECLNQLLGLNKTQETLRLAHLRLTGRLQKIADWPEIRVDVGHNPHAIQYLLSYLGRHPVDGELLVVLGMLADKNIAESIELLLSATSKLYLADTDGPRGCKAERIRQTISHSLLQKIQVECYTDPVTALDAARQEAKPCDRILVLGSFHTVAPVLEAYHAQPAGDES